MKTLTVIKRKQYFKIVTDDLFSLDYELNIINRGLRTYKLDIKYNKQTRRRERKFIKDRDYYVLDARDSSIRYPISVYGKVIGYLKNQGWDIKTIKDEAKLPEDDIDIEPNNKYTPRDYQEIYIDHILKAHTNNLLINLPTGYGKTFTVLAGLAKVKKRFGIIVLPRYIDKWVDDITHYTTIKKDEIYVVQGSDSLRRLMLMSEEDRDGIKAYVFSLKTVTMYIKEWLSTDEEFTYPTVPDDLIKELKIGYIVNDETHQEFHNVFITQLFLDSYMFIGLTATLINKNKMLMNMYEVLFPESNRPDVIKNRKRYINVLSVRYKFKYPKLIKYHSGFGYSQVKLEQSIMHRSETLKDYLEMLEFLTNIIYIKKKDRHAEDKLLIFAGTVAMCEVIRDHLRDSKLCEGLTVNKYTEEEDYEIVKTSNIIVSTIQSAGTALDIPNLVSVLQTVAIDSLQANKQSIGRLRELKGKEVVFCYTWSENIDSHKRYHLSRLNYFRDIAKDYRFLIYEKLI